MAKRMAAKVRQQNCRVFIFQELFIIAVSDDTVDCFVQVRKILGSSEPIDKNEIRIAVNRYFTLNPFAS